MAAAGKARHAAEMAFAGGMVDRDHRNPLAYPMLSIGLRHNFQIAKELIVDGYAASARVIDTTSAIVVPRMVVISMDHGSDGRNVDSVTATVVGMGLGS